MGYKLKYARQAEKDARKLEESGLDRVAIKVLAVIQNNPFQKPPPYERLKGDLKGLYSRRINKQHRIVYEILPNDECLRNADGEMYKGIVKIIRMWTHYE